MLTRMSDEGRARVEPRELERLRQARVKPERDLSLRGVMGAITKDLRRHARAVKGVGGAWEALVPGELRERTAVQGINRGVLTVKATDAATKYAVEVLLRGGLEREMIRVCAAPVRRVKVVV
jgi:hypothetical protein